MAVNEVEEGCRESIKRMTMRHAHHNPLGPVHSGKHPDVQKGRTAFEDAPKFKKCPSAPTTDIGKEGDFVAADREIDRLPDRLRKRVDLFRRQDLSRRINDFLRSTGKRLGQLDRFERLTECDLGIAHDDVCLVVQTAADQSSCCRDVVWRRDDGH